MEEETRRNPDRILKQIRQEEEEQTRQRGKLKIFFGYAAGVGKTYSMLKSAHDAQAQGIDTVIGYIEPHTRPETMALVRGLETLPVKVTEYNGMKLKELDLDGVIKRHPQLVLVDELAHTNSIGCRHKKRYQDVEEILKAGIDVYTTVNVQHIESLNDIVASVTGVIVRERIPDSVFDNADSVELADIEPKDLLKRLKAGKIYRETQAGKAMQNFFIESNLVALREIALRRTADRVNRFSEQQKEQEGKEGYYTDEHILICLSPSPSNQKVIRTASRMSRAFHGKFTAVFVKTEAADKISAEDEQRLIENVRLAEQLGAKITTIFGENIPDQIAGYAKAAGVSKIVIGRSVNRSVFTARHNFADRLSALAPNLDIYIIPDQQAAPDTGKRAAWKKEKVKVKSKDVIKTAGVFAVVTALGLWFQSIGFSESNIITIYILGTLITALVTEYRFYSLLFSVCSVLSFNFLFIQPLFTLNVYGSGYPVTFAIMLLSALISGNLMTRVKQQARAASIQAYRTGILLETNRRLQDAADREAIIEISSNQMTRLLDRAIIFYEAKDGRLLESRTYGSESVTGFTQYLSHEERAVAEWVQKNNKHAGATTDTLPGSKGLYLAVRSDEHVHGVIGICLEKTKLETFEKELMISMLDEIGLALEKDYIASKQKEAELKAQREEFRANLLRSISHDLRTPLTSISGNAGVLRQSSDQICEEKKQELYTDIYDDAMWLINLVENLLSVTRIENGTMKIEKEPEIVEEVILEAMKHIDRRKTEHHISVRIDDDMMMADMDAKLMIQVIINLVDNAIKYTKEGSHIEISAEKKNKKVLIEVADDGEGISDEAKAKLFDMFYTGSKTVADSRRSMGMGLALCKSIIRAHGGTISVRDRKPKGTIFSFELQAEEVIVHG